jgi:hypothetical protein
MSMKNREAQAFLKGKLRLECIERSNHKHFQFSRATHVTLPTVVALSRGDGELSFSNEKGLARSLGLTLDELQTSASCHISGPVVSLALAAHLLVHIDKGLLDDPVVHGEGCRAMAESLHRLLALIGPTLELRKRERDLAVRVRKIIVTLTVPHFHKIRHELLSLIDSSLSTSV